MKKYKCDNFKCADPSICPEYCSRLCSGKMNDGFNMCGCEACDYHRVVGPYITCKKADNSDYMSDTENTLDYDAEYDPIINP